MRNPLLERLFLFVRIGVVAWWCWPASIVAIQNPANWKLVKDLEIGSLEGETALTAVSGILLSHDGSRIFVAQPQEATIKIFDAQTGAFERTIGRRGSGPGEFQFLGRMGRQHDTMYVVEQRLQRVSLFTATGRHVRTAQVDIPPSHDGIRSAAVALTPQNGFWAEGQAASDKIANREISQVPIVLALDDGKSPRQVAQLSIGGTVGVAAVGSGVSVFRQPFNSADLRVYSPDGSAVAIVTATDAQNGRFSILRIQHTGDTAFVRTFAYRPARVPSTVRDSIEDMFARGLGARAGVSAGRAALRQYVKIPELLPPVSALLLTDNGDLWIQREKAGRTVARWLVLDGAGNWIATVRAPADLNILAARGRIIWGATVSSDGVPLVHRYHISK